MILSYPVFKKLSLDQRVDYLHKASCYSAYAHGKAMEFHASMVKAINISLRERGLPEKDFGEININPDDAKIRWEKYKKSMHDLNVETLALIPKEEPKIIADVPTIMPIIQPQRRDVTQPSDVPVPKPPVKHKFSFTEFFHRIIRLLKDFVNNHRPFCKRRVTIERNHATS